MNEQLYFFLRYTPFWAIPIMFIFIPFAYRYWLRGFTIPPLIFASLGVFAGTFLLLWVWAGGPDKIVQFYLSIIQGL